MEHSEFDAAFAKLAEGYREGTDIVSFNLFRVTSDRTLLKPCEMSAEKVVAFVLEFRPDT